jgi:predicted ABC-type ATPase
MPRVVVIGGPNGAGKSTFARFVLPEGMPFLNADEIAKTIPVEREGRPNMESGRFLLARMKTLREEKVSFAIESTMSSRALASRLRDMKSNGWRIGLYFFYLTNAELAIERVAARVRRGGHDIPVDTIRRRFASGLSNFARIYVPLSDEWHLFRSDDAAGPVLVAQRLTGRSISVIEDSTWITSFQTLIPT